MTGKVLFVSLAAPVPTTNGHRMRNRGLLQALRNLGYGVTLLSFAEESEIQSPAPELAELVEAYRLVKIPSKVSGVKQLVGRFLGLFQSQPYGSLRLRSPELKALIDEQLTSTDFDFVICDDVYILSNIPSRLNAPLLLNKHDITYEIMARFLTLEKNQLKKLYGSSEYKKVRRLEMSGCERATRVFVCSARDGQVLKRLVPGTEFSVVPNVIDVARYQGASRDANKLTLLYVGAMDWYPNRDAVEFFADEILPELRGTKPGIRFKIAGRAVPADLVSKYASQSDIEFTGEVPDMATEIARAAVVVVPLRIGSGTRLKILEAGAMQKAIVSTTIGAEGLDLVDGEEIVIADGAKHFAAAVLKLIDDPEMRVRIGRNIRKTVECHYSVQALEGSVADAIAKTIARDVVDNTPELIQ